MGGACEAPANAAVVGTAASGVALFSRGNINLAVAAPVALGSGAMLGARILAAVSVKRLRVLFVMVLFGLAVQMTLAAFGIHSKGVPA